MNYFKINLYELIKICLMGRETLIPPGMHQKRFAPEYIIYVMLEGTLNLRDNGKNVVLNPGDVYFFAKGEYHYPIEVSYCKYLYFHFLSDSTEKVSLTEEEYVKETERRQRDKMQSNLYNADVYRCENLIIPQKINISEYKNMTADAIKLSDMFFFEPRERINLSYFFTDWLMKLEKVYLLDKLKNSKQYLLALKIRSFVEANLNCELSAVSFENEFFLSYDYLNRIFKKHMGYSIVKYKNKCRIDKAKMLLKDNSKSVFDVGSECGFSDIFYFSRVFKKIEGVSPGQYRDCPVE